MRVYTLQVVCPQCKQAVCVVIGEKEVLCLRLHLTGWGVRTLPTFTDPVWVCPRCIINPLPEGIEGP